MLELFILRRPYFINLAAALLLFLSHGLVLESDPEIKLDLDPVMFRKAVLIHFGSTKAENCIYLKTFGGR